MNSVSIIMGSDSDLEIMKEAAIILEEFSINYSIKIISAHRTPHLLFEYATTIKNTDTKVIIAGAGGAAHLPGMVASLTSVPVIGVPIKTATLNGLDSLYSIVQMPAGIPVATMAINGARNAGIFAAQIIGSFDGDVYDKLTKYKNELNSTVLDKSEKLEHLGFSEYLFKN